MRIITLCYSNHRPENLQQTLPLMAAHDTVVLEEPPHPRFEEMLRGEAPVEEMVLEMDVEYPSFIRRSYRALQLQAAEGKTIVQVEPYLEELEKIHFFFADGHTPSELESNTDQAEVYASERETTRLLIEYYKASRADEFPALLQAISAFAKADAQRFRLRDRLRADRLLLLATTSRSMFIEAGAMHRYLFLLLLKHCPTGYRIRARWIEQELMVKLKLKGQLMGPGDMLTLAYMFRTPLEKKRETLLCARALIHAKIVHKEEISDSSQDYPHLRNDLRTIGLVKRLSLEECSELYREINPLPTLEAEQAVALYLQRRR